MFPRGPTPWVNCTKCRPYLFAAIRLKALSKQELSRPRSPGGCRTRNSGEDRLGRIFSAGTSSEASSRTWAAHYSMRPRVLPP